MTQDEQAIHVKMPAEKRREVKELAAKQGMSISSFVRSVLYQKLTEVKAQ